MAKSLLQSLPDETWSLATRTDVGRGEGKIGLLFFFTFLLLSEEPPFATVMLPETPSWLTVPLP